MRLRLCFLLKKFILSNSFNLIIGNFLGKIAIENKDSRYVVKDNRGLFNLFLINLLTKLIRRYIITLLNDKVKLIISCKRDIEDLYINLIDLVEIFYIFFP